MNELTPEQLETLARHLGSYLDRTRSANQQLSWEANRLRIHNANVQGRGYVELVETEMQLRGISFEEAAQKVATEHPDLYEKYRTGVQADF